MDYLKQGTIYKLNVIMNMDLPVRPALQVVVKGVHRNGGKTPVRDSHISKEQLLSVLRLDVSLWRYEYTTHTSVPMFIFDDPSSDWEYFFDATPVAKAFSGNALWITPKGFPHDQA